MAPYSLMVMVLTLHLQLSYAKNQLRLGESISSAQTLSSRNGVFVLGFLTLDNSTRKYYLAIWCNGSSPDTAIWIANRATPAFNHTGKLTLSNTSKLEVTDSTGAVLWSSSNPPSNSNTTRAELLDSGNLQILHGEAHDTVLWQSFDNITDTVLPGMLIWVDYRTHTTLTATSWSSPVDPTPGNYSGGLDPDVFMQMIGKRGQVRYGRTSVWNEQPNWCISPVENNSLCDRPPIYTMSPDWWNMSLGISRWPWSVRLLYNGSVAVQMWIPSAKIWLHVHTFDVRGCDVYNLCGPYGYCEAEGGPTCHCLPGFEQWNMEEWNGGNHSGGCVRINDLLCNGNEQFVRVGNMKLPDFNIYLKEVGNANECVEACRSNCSCVAYSYSDLWTSSEHLPRCLVWFEELIDLALVKDGDTGSSAHMGKDLYVRIQTSTSDLTRRKMDKAVVVGLPLVLGITLLVAGACVLTWRCKKYQVTKSRGGGERSSNVREGDEKNCNLNEGQQVLPNMDYQLLVSATNNFSELNKIGQGGFGNVYKGILAGGLEVAVKKLCMDSTQGLDEFMNEVQLISKLQHRNLVKLLNCGIHGDEKLLIYEYMPNRSLDLFLFNEEKAKYLDWDKRYKIIKGIARGLLYLHEESRLKIIHRDLKASNVLLDGDLNPKISDFGTARVFGITQNRASTNRVIGTYGYMSPEYAMEGTFSEKSDIYSFGVLILEIISGRRNSNFNSIEESTSLFYYAWKSWNEGNFMEMISPFAINCRSELEVGRCIHIGLLCVQDDLVDRPNMSSVVHMLENKSPIKSKPKLPVYRSLGRQDECIEGMLVANFISKNHLSITVLEGR